MIDSDSFSDKVKKCEKRAIRMEESYWDLRSAIFKQMKIYDEFTGCNPKMTLDCIRGMVEERILEYVPVTEVFKDNLS